MRATVHKVVSAKFDMHSGVQILNTSGQSRQDQIDLQSLASGSKHVLRQRGTPETQMTVSKRHSIIMMLTMRNEKLNSMRQKNRTF